MKTENSKPFSRLYFIAPFILQSTVWRILMRPFFYLFIDLDVVGLENLKNLKGPIIFAPNHPTEIDATLLPVVLPMWSRFSPMFYVAREPAYYQDSYFGLRRLLYMGWVFKMLGAFPVRSGMKDYSISLANHVRILKAGGAVCIFPEGVLSKNGIIGPAHGGVGYLIHAAKADVVPVYFEGIVNMTLADFFSRRRKARVILGTPILSEQLFDTNVEPTIDQYKAVGMKILDQVRSLEKARSALGVNPQSFKYLYSNK
jgi:1-acyl-sn-glycerol-3-phosphate acyltransferase